MAGDNMISHFGSLSLCSNFEGGTPTNEGAQGMLPLPAVSFRAFSMGTLNFEVICTKTLAKKLKRYVVYAVRIHHSKESEHEETIVERRYSDFERLHAELSTLFGDLMRELVFPRKLWAGNFSSENIARRSQMFEQYLSHLCDLPAVCRSRTFCQFFYANELSRSLHALVAPEGDNGRALQRDLRSCLLVQLKLHAFSEGHGALCAAAMVVAHTEADESAVACVYAEQLVDSLSNLSASDSESRDICQILLVPLLRALLELGHCLGRDVTAIERKLAIALAQERVRGGTIDHVPGMSSLRDVVLQTAGVAL